ncbi:MAG TPA: hypothetical protein DFR83_14770 [Deltaproteobacteria bacterium]|nr:hypothetical protein [Deltaproteobacteria bacterium]
MSITWDWLGRVPYLDCLQRQRDRRNAVLDGSAQEVVWLVEHPRTVTVGRRPAPGTPTPEALARHGIAFAKVERGGLATWHGPGQLVIYPILSLPQRGFTVRAYIHRLEQGIIDWLAPYGVDAVRRAGAPGVWVDNDKIAALGVHIRHGVSIHGIAVNVAPDLGDYAHIVPCGLEGVGVTSLAQLGVRTDSLEKLAMDLGPELALRLSIH